MEKIIQNFQDLSWWFSVVIAGIIVNIIANRADYLLSFLGKKWRERNQEAQQKYQELLEQATRNQSLWLRVAMRSVFDLLLALIALFMSLFLIVYTINIKIAWQSLIFAPLSLIFAVMGAKIMLFTTEINMMLNPKFHHGTRK